MLYKYVYSMEWINLKGYCLNEVHGRKFYFEGILQGIGIGYPMYYSIKAVGNRQN